MIRYLFTFVLVGLFYQVQCQEHTQKIYGMVEDIKTGEPVAFASVGIQDEPFSTVTNLDGEFSFIIPSTSGVDSITISSIGYELKKIAITEFSDDVILPIKLTLSETVLEAVTVLDSLSGKEIMALAAEKMTDNHPSEPTSMNVFYRERQLLDGAYVSLVEAALTVYDQYNIKKRKSPLRTKVKVEELRRSLVYKHPFNSWWQQDNLMMRSWHLNPIPYDARLMEKSAVNGEFKRVSMTTVLGQKTYIIESDNDDFWKTTYYVQAGSYAIVRVEESFDETVHGPKHWKLQGDSLQLDVHFKKRSVIVDFKEINNKYYPTFMQLSGSHNYYHEGKFLAQFGIMQDFIINDINWKNPTVVLRNEATRIGKSLLSKDYPYNEEFWKNYNVLQETPLEKDLVKDLEKKVSLNQQFANQESKKK